MKKKGFIAIVIVLVVAAVNVVIANHVQAQRNSLVIDNLTDCLAEGEHGGFFFWDEKENYCVVYEEYRDPHTGEKMRRVVPGCQRIVVNDCVRDFAFDCDYEDCPEGYEREF